MRCAWPADRAEPCSPIWRIVTCRQPNDQIMHADSFGRGNHGLGVGVRFEASDILRHCAGQQLHVLRQIADVTAKRVRRPLIEGSAIEAHVAAHRLPDADQQPRPATICRSHLVR